MTFTDEQSIPSTTSLLPPSPDAGSQKTSSPPPRVFIALGSNVGDRVFNLVTAIDFIVQAGSHIKGCGLMYESEPMYVESQDRFLNSVVEVSQIGGDGS